MRLSFVGKIFLLSFSIFFISACKPEKTQTKITPTESQPLQTSQEAKQTLPETKSENCTYAIDSSQTKMEWTAYKFTDKTPVKGTFTSAETTGATSASSLGELAKGLKMNIDGATLESGDPGRNLTVKEFFFAKFNPPFQIEAWVKDLQGDDTQGKLTIVLQMNGVTKEAPFAYTTTPEGEITALGNINLMDWNLQPAFDSIHQACQTLHTGKDGVAKTWDVVDLKILGKFNKNCGS